MTWAYRAALSTHESPSPRRTRPSAGHAGLRPALGANQPRRRQAMLAPSAESSSRGYGPRPSGPTQVVAASLRAYGDNMAREPHIDRVWQKQRGNDSATALVLAVTALFALVALASWADLATSARAVVPTKRKHRWHNSRRHALPLLLARAVPHRACSAADHGYLVPMTIESGPSRCSARVFVKPASLIHVMQSEAV